MSAAEQVETVHWDLAELTDGGGAEAVDALLGRAVERARAFAERYRGALERIDGAELAQAMGELAEIYDIVGRADSFASLDFSTDTADPARGALVALTDERSTELSTLLLFFELEWAALSDERVEELLAHEDLAFCRHHLRSARRYRPHLLSEPEERILNEKSVSGVSAWTRLFSELTAALEVELDDAEKVTLDVALARLDVALPRRSPRHRGGGHERARAGAAHARLRLQHAADRQGDRRPPALLPELAGRRATSQTRRATSRSRRSSPP